MTHPQHQSDASVASRRDPAIAALYAIFFLSGAAGLIYESIWTRYLGLFVGHSAYAQVLVLVIFLGGMSVGAFLIGRRTTTIGRPLLWYAVVELGIGLIGLFFHEIFVATTHAVYDHLFPAIGMGLLQTIVKWSVAAAMIIPQSIMLGMTFPLMSAGVVRRMPERAGKALATLYFTNSLGGALGVLVAGFWLVRVGGLPGTLIVAAMINLSVALLVMGVIRTRSGSFAATDQLVETRLTSGPWHPDRLWYLLIGTSFVTALSSFIYEISWIRMLSLVIGSATHSFELMLSAFILGLALGAWWIGKHADNVGRAVRTLAIVQLAMGSLAIATMPIYLSAFGWMASFMAAFARTSEGYLGFSISRYAICLAVMLPATICAGMTLPLITRALIAGSAGERAIGQVYAVNTLGSILGAGLAGLVLMPLLGLKWLLISGAALDLIVGVVLLMGESGARAWRFTPRRIATGGALALGLGLLIAASNFDHTVLTSGVYRYGTTQPAGTRDVSFYKDGRTATVSIRRQPNGALTLSTNGKPDASLGPEWLKSESRPPAALSYDAPTQLFIPLVALAHAPNAKSAVIIGQGSGMTSHALLASPNLRSVRTIEIEPEMVRASRQFLPANHRGFDDPRAQFVIDDARAFFASRRDTFDLILSEPSNPWVSGVSGLFTTEFYERVRSHLADDGVFAQWLHLYEIDDELVMSVLSAINDHFGAWSIFSISKGDILIVASPVTLRDPDWSVFAWPNVATDLRFTWPVTAKTLEALRLTDNVAMGPLVRRGVVSNSDYYPTLDLNAERARYMRTSAIGISELASGAVNLSALVTGRRLGLGESYGVTAGIPRLDAMTVNAASRSGDPRGGPSAAESRSEIRAFESQWASAESPPEWRIWARNFAHASGLVHGGMSGVADTAFFRGSERYVATHHGPAEAVASVAFLRGIAGWDFAEASTAGSTLLAAATKGDIWLDPDVLRDGLVMTRLRMGDVAGAEAAYKILAPHSGRPAGDLRGQLLFAHLLDAKQSQEGRGAGR
jgi:spermidine synthase